MLPLPLPLRTPMGYDIWIPLSKAREPSFASNWTWPLLSKSERLRTSGSQKMDFFTVPNIYRRRLVAQLLFNPGPGCTVNRSRPNSTRIFRVAYKLQLWLAVCFAGFQFIQVSSPQVRHFQLPVWSDLRESAWDLPMHSLLPLGWSQEAPPVLPGTQPRLSKRDIFQDRRIHASGRGRNVRHIRW